MGYFKLLSRCYPEGAMGNNAPGSEYGGHDSNKDFTGHKGKLSLNTE
jgi:hypothetical protein